MNTPLLLPELGDVAIKSGRWMVTIYNDNITPYELVVRTLMSATQCSLEEASIETWEAHNFGKAPVHFAGETECRLVADSIEKIGVKVEVGPEWTD